MSRIYCLSGKQNSSSLKSDVIIEWVRLTGLYLSVKTNKTSQIKPYLHSPVVPGQLWVIQINVMFCSPHISHLHCPVSTETVTRSEGTLGKSQREVVYECLIEQATIICSFLLRAIKHSYYPEFSSSSGKNILKQY